MQNERCSRIAYLRAGTGVRSTSRRDDPERSHRLRLFGAKLESAIHPGDIRIRHRGMLDREHGQLAYDFPGDPLEFHR